MDLDGGNDLGFFYELKFEEVLARLVQEKIIDGWEKTKHNSEDDAKGIDYWLIIKDRRIPWQITSTKSMVLEHKKTQPGIGSGEIPITNIVSKGNFGISGPRRTYIRSQDKIYLEVKVKLTEMLENLESE